MKLSLERVTELAREIVSQLDHRLGVVSVASNEGGSQRVELLVTIVGGRPDPSIIMINVSRAEPSELERDVKEKLREALSSGL